MTLTTPLPCQFTAIFGPNSSDPRTICLQALRMTMECQGWYLKEWDQEGDTAIARYIPSDGEKVADLAHALSELPPITPPTDGVFAEATFSLRQDPAYSSVTIKAPAHWLPQEAAP